MSLFSTLLSANGAYFVGTFWAFVPAIIAIALALITKQVYLSLFAGIFVGAMFLSEGEPLGALQNIFTVMTEQLGSNGGILIFLVVLGIFAVLMVKSGGSSAYGNWAAAKIKSRTGAQLATIGLGALIFVDDYFNCLTVGSVMRPVTDKHKVSHAKLAYLIDSTAAPICIIAPISSWAAAVSGYADGGIVAFIKTIPFNMYALLTVAMMIVFALLKFDMFKMRKNERIALETGDLDAGETDLPTEDIDARENPKGRVRHLIIPIVLLLVCCVGAMIYNGWSFLHTLSSEELMEEIGKSSFNILDMFSNCDSSIALATGSVLALIITVAYYAIAKVVSFKDCMKSLAEGFKSMVPAMLILVFAWTLCAFMGAKGEGLVDGAAAIDGTLNAKAFVQAHISTGSMAIGIIPFIFFLLACFISFATGTSWGTFGVLIPISTAVISAESSGGMFYLTMAAVLAGAVFGDHISPISDTTIMASSGARCNHIDHVRTQMPYAILVAGVCAVTYLISGFASQSEGVGGSYGASVGICLAVGVVLFAACVGVIVLIQHRKPKTGLVDNAAVSNNLSDGVNDFVDNIVDSEDVVNETVVCIDNVTGCVSDVNETADGVAADFVGNDADVSETTEENEPVKEGILANSQKTGVNNIELTVDERISHAMQRPNDKGKK